MTASPIENSNTRKRVNVICSKCKSLLESRSRRGLLVKLLLFWLPLKKYKCYRCNRSQYVLAES